MDREEGGGWSFVTGAREGRRGVRVPVVVVPDNSSGKGFGPLGVFPLTNNKICLLKEHRHTVLKVNSPDP
jgi:hypothetical protein